MVNSQGKRTEKAPGGAHCGEPRAGPQPAYRGNRRVGPRGFAAARVGTAELAPCISRRGGPPLPTLLLLRSHQVFRLEISAGVRDERAVRRMVDRLDPLDAAHQRRVVMVDVLDELGLRVG